MPAKSSPYQPLLLRILHGLIGLSVLLAILSAYWTYETYDGRWLSLGLPDFKAIEGIHGTFGLWALLIFPAFVIYAFRRGQQRLLQPDSFAKLTQLGRPIGWYSLHRLVNTLTILALTFALFSGKMMDETWLPNGELNHAWYYAHLISWVVMVGCIALHVLMGAKIGGSPLLLSMVTWQVREKDSPWLWRTHISAWWSSTQAISLRKWLSVVVQLSDVYRVLEAIVLVSLVAAWIIPLFK
ncbi:MAG: cytochrome b/b6 domain-containing protein [Oculatellaceae cyanobacterium bins.114]|nr:cytochrome b/b6 domain-containing protein [Oculatellaceae cyanobacterium bins.114]